MARIGKERIEDLSCKCTKGDIAPFRVREDCIECIWCGNKVVCKPPIEFVVKEKCKNCGETTTFIVDSLGTKICTKCGKF